MTSTTTGVLKGNVITLDAPLPPLDGMRVRIVVEPMEEAEIVLTPEENARLLREWIDHGPQGPLDEDPAIP